MSIEKNYEEYQNTLSVVFKHKFYEWYNKQTGLTTKQAETYWSNIISDRLEKVIGKVEKEEAYLKELNFHLKFEKYIKSKLGETLTKSQKDKIKISKVNYILVFIHQLQKIKLTNGIDDKYALCCGFDSYQDFKNKYDTGLVNVLDTESDISEISEHLFRKPSLNAIPDIATDKAPKAVKIRDFFNSDCYLYVFDQNSADDRKKEDYHSNIDALVLENKNNDLKSFFLHNLGGKKEHYENGVLDWGDKERKTFNINFNEHRRNLYMRFNCINIGDGIPEIMIGKYIFSLNSDRQVISGSIILSKEKEIKFKTAYNYDFKYQANRTHTPPEEIQEYLRDKFYNFQKAPKNIFKNSDLKEWLENKFGKSFIKQNIIEYDYLITYPISSFDKDKREELFISIENILLKGIKKESKSKKELINKLNKYFEGKYQKDRNKSRILIYPKNRDAGYDPNVGDNEKFNLEFIKYIKQSSNIIIIVPQSEYSRPSSVYTFAGFCMALRKKVFIFYENENLLPVVFQKECKSIGVYTIKYADLNDIPLYINRELGYIKS